jgi:hypothetical protein
MGYDRQTPTLYGGPFVKGIDAIPTDCPETALPRHWRRYQRRTGFHPSRKFGQIMPTRRVADEALPAVDLAMSHNPALGIMC